MRTEQQGTRDTRTRRSWFTIISVLAAVVVIGVMIVPGMLSAEEPDSAFDDEVPRVTQAPPAPDATPTAPADVPQADQDKAEDAAATTLEEVLPVVAEIEPDDGDNIVSELSDVGSQAFLSELESERLEFEAEGWSREGEYVIDGIETLEYTEDGDTATAVVRACIDSSALVIRRADGEIVETDSEMTRAWQVFVLEQTDDSTWRIVGRSFSDDPSC